MNEEKEEVKSEEGEDRMIKMCQCTLEQYENRDHLTPKPL